jgi:hypothetical protein
MCFGNSSAELNTDSAVMFYIAPRCQSVQVKIILIQPVNNPSQVIQDWHCSIPLAARRMAENITTNQLL